MEYDILFIYNFAFIHVRYSYSDSFFYEHEGNYLVVSNRLNIWFFNGIFYQRFLGNLFFIWKKYFTKFSIEITFHSTIDNNHKISFINVNTSTGLRFIAQLKNIFVDKEHTKKNSRANGFLTTNLILYALHIVYRDSTMFQ